MSDLRVDLFRLVEKQHMFRSASAPSAPQGEAWSCRCGKSYKGKGALERGHRHVAKKVLKALDKAGVLA